MGILISAGIVQRPSLESVLLASGFSDCLYVDSPDQVVEHIRRCPRPALDVDLILVDVSNSDGVASARSLLAAHECEEIPVILVGSARVEELEAGFEAGATDYVSYPLRAEELRARIRRALHGKRVMEDLRHHRKRWAEDMSFARRVQRGVLCSPLNQRELQINAVYVPSDGLSGDMYYWHQVGPDRFGILLVDVMGHGISAALVSMAIRSLTHGLITRVVDPVTVLQELKKHMLVFKPMYLTALYLVIDLRARVIEYANAGHPPGLLLQPDGSVLTLDRTTIPIGLSVEAPVEARVVPFERPARILLYTDGLLSEPGKSPRKAIEELKRSLLAHGRRDSDELMAGIMMERDKILSASDDICLIAVTVEPPRR